jgi:AraC family transcriptional regulator
MSRPDCYPAPPPALRTPQRADGLPLLDVLTSPVPEGRFDSPLDSRPVLCLHRGAPVPVTWRAGRAERAGVRLHSQFCVVPAGSGTRWTLSAPATSLLLRLAPAMLSDAADALGRAAAGLAPSIHVRDPQIERIAALMEDEARAGHPGGSLFADSLASALAARLLVTQGLRPRPEPTRALPGWRLRAVFDYIDAHLDTPLRLAELAAVAGFSLSHFKTMFRAATGTPVHRYVLERRTEHARHLLATTTRASTDIAAATGFAHPSHMARSLRRLHGCAPADLRPGRA